MVSPLTAIVTLLVLTTIPTSSAKGWGFYPRTYHVHIANELSHNEDLFVQCHCTHAYRPVSYVKVGTEYEWRFKSHVLGVTRWHCHLAPDSIRHVSLVVYEDSMKTYRDNVYWVVKDDGVYSRDPSTKKDAFVDAWSSWSPALKHWGKERMLIYIVIMYYLFL
ncbi:hypothetical protein LINPERPRIM_LOCUS26874 [Linum perenne]